MFACIYFEEDYSVSVVGKENTDLKVEGSFEVKSRVEMVWKVGTERETFHGPIIKIDGELRYYNWFFFYHLVKLCFF